MRVQQVTLEDLDQDLTLLSSLKLTDVIIMCVTWDLDLVSGPRF